MTHAECWQDWRANEARGMQWETWVNTEAGREWVKVRGTDAKIAGAERLRWMYPQASR